MFLSRESSLSFDVVSRRNTSVPYRRRSRGPPTDSGISADTSLQPAVQLSERQRLLGIQPARIDGTRGDSDGRPSTARLRRLVLRFFFLSQADSPDFAGGANKPGLCSSRGHAELMCWIFHKVV